jgi:hypothetical protein
MRKSANALPAAYALRLSINIWCFAPNAGQRFLALIEFVNNYQVRSERLWLFYRNLSVPAAMAALNLTANLKK